MFENFERTDNFLPETVWNDSKNNIFDKFDFECEICKKNVFFVLFLFTSGKLLISEGILGGKKASIENSR